VHVLSLLDTSLPGSMTLVPSVLYSQLVSHRYGHCDHSVSFIPGQGILFSQLRLEQFLLFDPSHPMGCWEL
jgi:hypothetical protein